MDYRALIFVALSLICFGLSDFLVKIVSTNFESLSGILHNTKVLFPGIAFLTTALLGFFFWFVALRYGDISKLAPIQKMSLFITVPLGILILHEAFTWKTIVASIFAILAIVFLVI